MENDELSLIIQQLKQENKLLQNEAMMYKNQQEDTLKQIDTFKQDIQKINSTLNYEQMYFQEKQEKMLLQSQIEEMVKTVRQEEPRDEIDYKTMYNELLVEKKQLSDKMNSIIKNYEKVSSKIEKQLSPQQEFSQLRPMVESVSNEDVLQKETPKIDFNKQRSEELFIQNVESH